MLALPPFYYKGVSDDGLFRFFAELIERVGDDRLRLFLYHIPPMAQVGFTPELIGRLLDAYPGDDRRDEGLRGRRRRGSRRSARRIPQLTVFAGSERFLLDTLRWGGDGCISATVNVTARQSREVYDLFAAGEDADAAQAALTEARGFLEGYPPIPALKAILRDQTGDDVWLNLRPPLDALDPARAAELLARLNARRSSTRVSVCLRTQMVGFARWDGRTTV